MRYQKRKRYLHVINLSNLVCTILIILLALVAIAIVTRGFVLPSIDIYPFNQEEFMIYKEECRNESREPDLNRCFEVNQTLYGDYDVLCYICPDFVGLEEVCEQVEVDEIVLKNIQYGIKSIGGNISVHNASLSFIIKVISDKQYIDVVSSKEQYWYGYCLEDDYPNLTISAPNGFHGKECRVEEFEILDYEEIIDAKATSKQDLTRAWLNENAECIEWCDYELYRKPLCYKNKEDSSKDWKEIDNLICSKYKYRDYFVEIKQ